MLKILLVLFIFSIAMAREISINSLDKYQVIFLPEEHTSKEDHKFQLDVIKFLYSKGHKILIAMEMFQQPFQWALDRYINCQIEEGEMLSKTEYKKRWGHDPTLYRDIWTFAKEKGISIRAINIPSELVKRIREEGLEKVRDERLPYPIIEHTEGEKKALREFLSKHPRVEEKRFFDVQNAWDNGMALAIARLLEDFPDYKILVLVGRGHAQNLESGIPRRLKLLKPNISMVILNREDHKDFLFSMDFSKESSSANSIREPNCKP